MALALALAGIPGVARAEEPVATARPPVQPGRAGLFRLKTVVTPANPTFRINDPASRLRSGYGGALVDLFPFEGGKFHLSGGGRLFGRSGRPRSSVDPESMRYLPSSRAGSLRPSRRFAPTMLVGYGRIVEQGLALGIDAGVMQGRFGATPDRLGRLNRRRLETLDGRSHRSGMNELVRMTALYRF